MNTSVSTLAVFALGSSLLKCRAHSLLSLLCPCDEITMAEVFKGPEPAEKMQEARCPETDVD